MKVIVSCNPTCQNTLVALISTNLLKNKSTNFYAIHHREYLNSIFELKTERDFSNTSSDHDIIKARRMNEIKSL